MSLSAISKAGKGHASCCEYVLQYLDAITRMLKLGGSTRRNTQADSRKLRARESIGGKRGVLRGKWGKEGGGGGVSGVCFQGGVHFSDFADACLIFKNAKALKE